MTSEADPERAAAMRALGWISAQMGHFGAALRPIPGKVIRDRDADGRSLPVSEWERGPDLHPEPIPRRTLDTIILIGLGSLPLGLEMVAAATQPSGQENSAWALAETRKFLDRWTDAYRSTKLAVKP